MKVIKEVAARHTPTTILDLQTNINEDAESILLANTKRIKTLLKDKSHYFHKGRSTKSGKVPFIQQKKEILQELISKSPQNRHN